MVALIDNRIKILIADDNLVIQKVTLLMLKNLGIIADLAANGQEVLLALEKWPYEVVIMDIKCWCWMESRLQSLFVVT
jgi:CheY-like chemotaxis protein